MVIMIALAKNYLLLPLWWLVTKMDRCGDRLRSKQSFFAKSKTFENFRFGQVAFAALASRLKTCLVWQF